MPSSPRTLRANFSWTVVANVIYAACQWGIISAFAKIGNAQMVGEFALALAITGPIQALLQMQLRGVQATDARRDYEDGEYFSFRAITTVIAIAVSIGVIVLGDYSPRLSWVIVLVSLGKGIDSISDVFYGAFQQRERMDFIAKAMIAKGVLSLILAVVGLWWSQSIVIASAGFALGSLLPLVFYTLPLATTLQNPSGDPVQWWLWSTSRARTLFRLALPLGIVMTLISLDANIPRYVIDYQLGTQELGIYAALAYLLVAGTTVVNAMGQAVSPRLAHYFATGQFSKFTGMLRTLVLGSLGLGLAGVLLSLVAGRWILRLLYTPEYGEYVDVLAILALGGGLTFAASIAGYGLTAARKFDVQVPIFIIVVIANFALAIPLISAFGLRGAAISVSAAKAVNLIACWFVLARVIRAERVNQNAT